MSSFPHFARYKPDHRFHKLCVQLPPSQEKKEWWFTIKLSGVEKGLPVRILKSCEPPKLLQRLKPRDKVV